MSKSGAAKWLDRSDRVYRLLLRTYPVSFRREYGLHMAQAFRDNCRSILLRSGPRGMVRLWFHTVFDWVRSASEQHVREAFNMSARRWIIRLGAASALLGGVLGIVLVTMGPNSYGNYGWDGWLAAIAACLLALGVVGAIAVLQDQVSTAGKWGLFTILVGLILMALGHLVEPLWSLIFFGPLIIAPIGAVLLGADLIRHPESGLPAWWRWFPVAVVAIALLGFAIELLEGVAGNSTPDRGVQLAEALLSIVWILLGIGLLLAYRDTPDDPQLAA